jgi:hypothetical protein
MPVSTPAPSHGYLGGGGGAVDGVTARIGALHDASGLPKIQWEAEADTGGTAQITSGTSSYDGYNKTLTVTVSVAAYTFGAIVIKLFGYPSVTSGESTPDGGTGLAWNSNGLDIIDILGVTPAAQVVAVQTLKDATFTYIAGTRMYTKLATIDLMTDLGYSFEIPAEVTLR